MKKLFLLAALFACAVSPAYSADSRVITVTGEAKQKIKPDLATFSTTVYEESTDQTTVKQKLDAKVRSWQSIVQDFGINEDDQQSNYVSVSRRYDYVNNERVFRGYTAQANLSIKIRDMSRLPALQDRLSKSGFESVNGPDFSLEDPDKAKEAILREALSNARRKAEELAESVNERLGRPVQIVESGAQVNLPQPYYARGKVMAMSADMAESAPQLPSGVVEVEAQITASFELLAQ